MSEMYSEKHRALQQRFDTSRLADRLEALARPTISDATKTFIKDRDTLFLTSKYAPQADRPAPPAPQWKRIDLIQDALPKREKDVAKELGGVITFEEYGAKVSKSEG